MQRKLMGIVSAGFDVPQVKYWSYILYSSNTWDKMEIKWGNSSARNKAYDSVRREDLYNTFIEYGIPMKLVRSIKMSLN
jgi:hypothetical protein